MKIGLEWARYIECLSKVAVNQSCLEIPAKSMQSG
jgi:hypothetical protein